MAYDYDTDIDDDDDTGLSEEQKDQKTLDRIDKILKSCMDKTSEQRNEARDCEKHIGGDHFSPKINKERKDRVNIIKNDAPIKKRKIEKFWKKREATLKFHAVENKDKDIARILQGMGNYIDRNSMAQFVKNKAFGQMLSTGQGGYYIDVDFDDSQSGEYGFNLEIKQRPIKSWAHLVYDADAIELDRSDAMYGGFYFEMSKEDYKKIEGDDLGIKPKSIYHDDHITVDDDSVLCYRHYEREFEEDRLVAAIDWRETIKEDGQELPNPTFGTEIVIRKSKDKALYRDLMQVIEDEGNDNRITNERDIDIPVVSYWEVSGDKIITEKQKWGGQTIPIVTMLGEDYRPANQDKHASCIRWNKDLDQAYDYFLSSMAEEVSTSPKTKWMGAKEKFAGLVGFWANSHKDKFSHLPFNNIYNKKTGELIDGAPPTPISGAKVPDGWLMGMQTLAKDKDDTSGIQPGALGAEDGQNSKSGAAVIARSNESMDTAEPFYDARIYSLHVEAKILTEVIPVYYEMERMVRILGEDGKESIERINADGGINIADLKIHVYPDTGPAFATQRKEENAGLFALMGALPPQLAATIAPFAVDGSDWKNANEISSVLKKQIGPELYDNGEEKSPEMMQQMMQQLESKMQKITQENDGLRELVMTEVKTEQEKTDRAIKVENLKTDRALRLANMDNSTATKNTVLKNQNTVELQDMKSQAALNEILFTQMAAMTATMGKVSAGMEGISTQLESMQPQS